MASFAGSASARRNPQAVVQSNSSLPTPPTSDPLNKFLQGFDAPPDYDEDPRQRTLPSRSGSMALQQPPAPEAPIVYNPTQAQQQQFLSQQQTQTQTQQHQQHQYHHPSLQQTAGGFYPPTPQQQHASPFQAPYQQSFPQYPKYPPPQAQQLQTQPIHPYGQQQPPVPYPPQHHLHQHPQGAVYSQPLAMPRPVQYSGVVPQQPPARPPVAAAYGQPPPGTPYLTNTGYPYQQQQQQQHAYPTVQSPRQPSPLPPSPILSPVSPPMTPQNVAPAQGRYQSQSYLPANPALQPGASITPQTAPLNVQNEDLLRRQSFLQERRRLPSESSSVFSLQYQQQQQQQQQLPSPGSPPDSMVNPYRQPLSPTQANQDLANLAHAMQNSFSSLSLTQPTDINEGVHRQMSIASSVSATNRRNTVMSDRSSSSIERSGSIAYSHSDTNTIRHRTIPATLHPDTAAALIGLPIEDMPSCFIIAPPFAATSTNGNFTPFRVMAPCQAILLKDGPHGPPHHHALHMPEDQGYSVNNPEAIITAHGTLLRQMATTAWMISSSVEPAFGKSLATHAEKFLKLVPPVEKVTYALDPPEIDHSRVARGATVTAAGGAPSLSSASSIRSASTAGDYVPKESGTVLIEKHLFEYRHMDSLARLMRDITGSRLSSDWTGGLRKITLPLGHQHRHGYGYHQQHQETQTLWVCHNCVAGFESGRYRWHDQQARLTDLIGLPVFSGLKIEAKLFNALAVEVFTKMGLIYQKISPQKDSDPKQVVLHLHSTSFDQPERAAPAVFTKNQKLFESLSLALISTHMTRIEIHGNQKPGVTELTDASNIYVHLRRIFECYHLQIVKITNMPYLLRGKLSQYLGKAVDIHLDGVLLDTDMALTNMKKILVENTDMTHLTLKNARLKSSGLKTLCSAHKHLRRLVLLDLSQNILDADGIKELSNQVMPTSLNLILLNLSENPSVGPQGCMVLLDAIWPSDKKASFETKQRGLKYLLMNNTGFTDSAASHLCRALESRSPGVLHTLNLSDNQMTKTGLTDLMQTMERTSAKGPAFSTLRRVSLNQYCTAVQAQQQAGKLFMDNEVIHTLSLHPFLTHVRLSRLGLEIIGQTIGLNAHLVSFIVDDAAVLGGGAIQNNNYMLAARNSYDYAIMSFKTLAEHLEANRSLQELKIYLPQSWSATSFWSLVFQSAIDSGDSRAAEGVWALAAKWMVSLESHLKENRALKQFVFAGVVTAGDPENEKDQEESLRRDWDMVHNNGGENVSEDDRRMAQARLGIRAILERNMAMFYGRKHGVERLLQQQWVQY